jgi:hypothetical protein
MSPAVAPIPAAGEIHACENCNDLRKVTRYGRKLLCAMCLGAAILRDRRVEVRVCCVSS